MAIDEQPATKQDLEVVEQNLEALRGDLKGELAAVERRLVERIDDVEAHTDREPGRKAGAHGDSPPDGVREMVEPY